MTVGDEYMLIVGWTFVYGGGFTLILYYPVPLIRAEMVLFTLCLTIIGVLLIWFQWIELNIAKGKRKNTMPLPRLYEFLFNKNSKP